MGCFAMTDEVAREIYKLTSAAIYSGQKHLPVHVFPFRMSQKNLAAHATSPWFDFWSDLKEGYDAFERNRRLPRVSVCDGRYHIEDTPAAAADTESEGNTTRRQQSLARIRVACPPKDTQSFKEAAATESGPSSVQTLKSGQDPLREAKQH